MKILVCITCVPDTTTKITFTENNTKLNKTGVQFIIGPYDDYALSRAIELKEQLGGTVTVLNVGTAEGEPIIRKALALGAGRCHPDRCRTHRQLFCGKPDCRHLPAK